MDQNVKKFDISNKLAVIIGLSVFVAGIVVFWFMFGKWPEKSDPNLRLVEELNTKQAFDKNSPEWLAIRTGELGAMLANGEIGAEEMIEELSSLSTVETQKAFVERKDEYLISISDYQRLIRSTNEQVVNTRYSVAVYTSEDESYIERVQYFKKLKLFFKQRYKKEDGQWKIVADGAINDFGFARGRNRAKQK